MSYTFAQLVTYYENANIGFVPSGDDLTALDTIASQIDAGSLTDAAAVLAVAALSQDKTDVALTTYEFFTGSVPTMAGLQYLVNGTKNANDLLSKYYTAFNKENRYYNFSMNLATVTGSTFAAKYGSLTFAQAVSTAYDAIIGIGNVGANYANQAISAIAASQPYFAAIAAERAPKADPDIAVKAVMVGYILEEAVKADLGTYAKGLDVLMAGLATTNTLVGTDLVALSGPTYAITVSGPINEGQTETFTITTNNVAPGTSVAYTVTGTANAASVSGSGSVVLDANGQGTVAVTVPINAVIGDAGTLKLALTNGKATSTTVAVADISATLPTYAITTSGPINEGQTESFTIKTTNVATGTSIGYTITGTANASGQSGTGTAVIGSNGQATVTVTVPTNSVSGDAGTLQLALTGGLATSASVAVSDVSPTYAITTSGPINEGQSETFTIKTTNVASGTSIGYTITGAANAAGQSGTGTAVIGSNGQATVTVSVPSNAVSGDAGTLQLALAGGLATSASVAVGDASPTYAITTSGAVAEGAVETFTLTTTSVASGAQLNYSLTGTGSAASLTTTGKLTVAANGVTTLPVTVPTNIFTGDSGTLALAVTTLASTTVTSSTVNVTDATTPPSPNYYYMNTAAYNLVIGVAGAAGVTVSSAIDTSALPYNGGAANGQKLYINSIGATSGNNVAPITDANVTALHVDGANLALTLNATNLTTITSGDTNPDQTIDLSAVSGSTNGVAFSMNSATGRLIIAGHAASSKADTLAAAAGPVTFTELGQGSISFTHLGPGDNVITDAAGSTSAMTISSLANTANGNNTISLNGSGVHTVTLGNGNDSVSTGSGADIITLGTGTNVVHSGAGADHITFAAHGSAVDTVVVAGAYAATNATAGGGTTVSTTAYEIITGLQAGDHLDLSAFAATSAITVLTSALDGAGAAGQIEVATGAYTAGTNQFVVGAGSDTLLTFDEGSGTYGAVVLVGFVPSPGHATVASGVVTF